MGPFQLFPPPSPDIDTKASRIPIRKGKKPAPGVDFSSIPLQEINEKDARRTREDDVKIQPPRKVHVKSHSEGGLGSQPTPAWTLRSVSQDDRASSSSSSLANNSSTQIPPSSSADILSKQPYHLQQSTSRLPPFRHKPLPPRPLPPRPQPRPRGLTLSPEPEIDRDLGPKTVPASVMNFPAGIRESVEMRDSSTAELRELWDVANGQRMEGGLGRFCLRLARTGISTFTLGNAQHPFYTITLTTNTNNKPTSLSISRTNPSNPQINIPIMSLALEDHHQSRNPNDNLVTQLFSHLAAMLAIEQSAEVAAQQNLSPADALEAEGKALRRAVEMESCELVWVRERAGYELVHPSSVQQQQQQQRGKGQTALVGAAGIALSPAPAPTPSPLPSPSSSPTRPNSKNPAPLHITVSTPSDTSTEEEHPQPPTIIATTPIPQNTTPTPHLTATPRTSTLPHTDSPIHDPLATLDLGTMTLGISTEAVVRAVPGWLYAVDSVVAAVLAVGVVDGRVGGVRLGMDVGGCDGSSSGGDVGEGEVEREREREVADWDSNSTTTSPNHSVDTSTTNPSPKDMIQIYTTKTINTIKTALSTINTWTRSLPSKLPPALRLKRHLPIHNQTTDPNNTTTTTTTTKPNKPNLKSYTAKRLFIEEFNLDLDLEHYGHHPHSNPNSSSGSEEGGQLPTATRGILKALFWGLEVVVCGLVMLVKGVVWLVLRVSGWVCSVAGAVRRRVKG